jgi:nucleotide-binding universal stress UspA family protein
MTSVKAMDVCGTYASGARSERCPMIKVILVRLDGEDLPDGLRLAAAAQVAEAFGGAHIVGLYVNVLPSVATAPHVISGETWATLLAEARDAGDVVAAALTAKLAELDPAAELRRFDVLGDEVGSICAREARAADVYVTLRPSKSGATERLDVVETVLFRGGRHVLVTNGRETFGSDFDHAIIAWNGSREAARALAEARPYLLKSRKVTVLVVDRNVPIEIDALIGEDAVKYLGLHGIDAQLRRVQKRGGVSETITEETQQLHADLLVMGGYGNSRLGVGLLGVTPRALLRMAPETLLIAH